MTAPSGDIARRELAPNATGAGVTVLVNVAAGSAGDELREAIRRQLPDAEIVDLGEGDDLGDVLRDVATRASVIGVAGGDGSINAAAAVALDHDLPLLVVPGGTLNHFARDAGLDDVDDAAGALQRGEAIAVDVGLLGDRVFLNTASFGSYPELVRRREQLESRLGKWPAFALAIVRVLRSYEPCPVTLDGRVQRVWMIFVGNCAYTPAGLMPARRARLDDGRFDIRLVTANRRWSRSRVVLALLFGRHHAQVFTRSECASVSVELGDAVPLSVDGEVFDGPRTFTITKHPRPLVVYAPADAGTRGT